MTTTDTRSTPGVTADRLWQISNTCPMTLVRISTQARAQASFAVLVVAAFLGALAWVELSGFLVAMLVCGLVIAGPLGAILAARRFREMDRARPAPADSGWTNGRLRGLGRVGAGMVYPAVLVLMFGQPSFDGMAAGLLVLSVYILTQTTTDVILAAHVERRDGVVLLELRGWWGRETPTLYTAPAPPDAQPAPAHH